MRHLFILIAMLAVDITMLDARITRGLANGEATPTGLDTARLVREAEWLFGGGR